MPCFRDRSGPCFSSDPTASAATRTCRLGRPTRGSAPTNAPSAPTASSACCTMSARTAAVASCQGRYAQRASGAPGSRSPSGRHPRSACTWSGTGWSWQRSSRLCATSRPRSGRQLRGRPRVVRARAAARTPPVPSRPLAVVFDVIETLFALDPLRGRMAAAGVPGARLEAWFARTLRDGMALDATGLYRPFKDVATAALLGLMAEEGVAPDRVKAEGVVAGFAELPAQPDAGAAMRRLREAGVRVAALTNGAAALTRGLLEKAGLAELVERVISVAEVEHWKPRPEVYRHAPTGSASSPPDWR